MPERGKDMVARGNKRNVQERRDYLNRDRIHPLFLNPSSVKQFTFRSLIPDTFIPIGSNAEVNVSPRKIILWVSFVWSVSTFGRFDRGIFQVHRETQDDRLDRG